MRIATILFTIALLAATTPVRAQGVSLDQLARPDSSIVESGRRAALRLVELQPNATAQRGRRKGRLYGGLTMLGIGAGLLVVAVVGAGQVDYDDRTDAAETAFSVAALSGFALMGAGGIMIALADSTSPVRVRGREPQQTTVVSPTRGGGAVFRRITF